MIPSRDWPCELQGWALLPGTDSFEAVLGTPPVVRLWSKPPPRFDIGLLPSIADMSRSMTEAWGRRYAIPRLAWGGVVYATTDDLPRVEPMLRLGAGAVLLVIFLKGLCL